MEGVISLGVGQPDFVTPNQIRQAAIKSIEDGETYYTSNYGLVELRAAISQAPQPAVRRQLRRRHRDHRHGGRQRGAEHRARSDPRSRRRSAEPRSRLRRVHAVRAAGGRQVHAGADARRGRLPAPARGDRAADHAALEGAAHRLSGEPDGRGDEPRDDARRRGDRREAQPLRHLATRSTTAWCTAPSTSASRRCRTCGADDPARRLLEGVRDDGLAAGVHLRAQRADRSDDEGAPVRDDVRADARRSSPRSRR